MGFGSMGVSCVAGGCVVEGDGAAGLDDDCLGRIEVVSAIAGRGTLVATAAAPFVYGSHGAEAMRDATCQPFWIYVTTHLRLLCLGWHKPTQRTDN